jgi:prevent-host-death family protein
MTVVMALMVSKAAFKARALEIMRQVEATGQAVVITDRGKPVLRVEPYFGDQEQTLASLRGSVIEYQEPTELVALGAWEALP